MATSSHPLNAATPAPAADTAEERKPSLSPLLELLGDDLKEVNTIIMDKMQSPVALIPQLAGHLIASGGKRLRPLLTLASAQLCAAEGQRQMSLAACVEFIHTATLLHDDVVDESDLRRGLATANSVWGNKASVLVGDFLFSRAFQLMTADGSLKVLKVLSDASAIIAEGEVLQLMTANDITTDANAYMQVIEAKTAALFAAACQVGAIVADENATCEQALHDYGMALGIAFQLVDDILDYDAPVDQLGKNLGDDFREGKITLPVVLAIAQANEEERAFWKRCLEDLEQDEDNADFEHALTLMRKYGSLETSKQRARDFGEKARAALDVFKEGAIKSAMLEAVDFCIDRLH